MLVDNILISFFQLITFDAPIGYVWHTGNSLQGSISTYLAKLCMCQIVAGCLASQVNMFTKFRSQVSHAKILEHSMLVVLYT